MIAHLIKDGIVVNTIEVESLDFMPGLVEAVDGGIGWSYENGKFIAPNDVEVEIPPAPTKQELFAQVQALTAQIQALR